MVYLKNIAYLSLAFAGFAVLHSLTAGMRLKDWLKKRLDPRLVEGFYRLVYNIISALTILPVLGLVLLLPDRTLYVLSGTAAIALRVVQLLAVIGLLGALFFTEVWQFAGLAQVVAYLNDDPLPLPSPPLQTKGMYGYVRHPLYFFSLIAVWAIPVMTVNVLLLNIWITLYFVVGSLVEEQRLLRIYGEPYRAYRKRVSWLVPLPHIDWKR